MSASDRFDRQAAEWDTPARIALADAVSTAMIVNLLPQQTDRLLDLGSGTGLVGLKFATMVQSVTALDISQPMLDVLRHKADRAGYGNVDVCKGLLADLSPDIQFDIIVSSMMFHHVADIEQLCAQIKTRLVPGGRLAIADLCEEDGSFHSDMTGVEHLGFAEGKISASIQKAGFRINSYEKIYSMARDTTEGVKNYDIFLLVAMSG